MKNFLTLIALLSVSAYAQQHDLLYKHQWYLHADGQELIRDLNDLNSETLIASGVTNWGYEWFQNNSSELIQKEVTVAVIDGGVDANHPDLLGQVLTGKNFATDDGVPDNDTFDETGHGTHVAGIIAAKHNVIGIAGISDHIKILPIKVFHANEKDYKKLPLSRRIEDGIKYAIEQNVDVINLSLGWPKVMHTKGLQEIIELAIKNDILVVAASGNSSNLAKIYPCVIKDVVCVGSIDPLGELSRFSNTGHTVDIVTPGEMIISTYPTHLAPLKFSYPGYEKMSGTSQAAPIASGMLAILKSVFPKESAIQLKHRFFSSGRPFGNSLYGLPDLKKTIDQNKPNTILHVKHLPHLVLDENYQFALELPYNSNFGKNINIEITSDILFFEKKSFLAESTGIITLKGFYFGNKTKAHIEIWVKQTDQKFKLSIALLKSMTQTAKYSKVKSKSKQQLLIKNEVKLISKLKLVPSLSESYATPLFYFHDENNKSISLYHFYQDELQEFKQIQLAKDCRPLRFFHFNLDFDDKNDYFLESYCEVKDSEPYLSYQFFDENFIQISSSISFKPEVALINFQNVLFKKIESTMHVFFTANAKLPLASQNQDPWADPDKSKKLRIYHLEENNGSFQTKVLNDYRFDEQLSSNQYQILHVDFQQDQMNMLISSGEEWNPSYTSLNISYSGMVKKTHSFPLNALIREGQIKKQNGKYILESFYTPYQGKIRFFDPLSETIPAELRLETPLTNPMLGGLGHFITDNMHGSIVKSYLFIHFLSHKDGITTERKIPYQRLDFSGRNDLQEQLIFINSKEDDDQLGKLIIDGTSISLETLKIISFVAKGEYNQTNFHIPKNCAGIGLSKSESQLRFNFLCAVDKGLSVVSQEI